MPCTPPLARSLLLGAAGTIYSEWRASLTTLGVALPAITTLTNKLHRHAITSAHSLNGVRLSLERSPAPSAQMSGLILSPYSHHGGAAPPGLPPYHLRSGLGGFPGTVFSGKSPYGTASIARDGLPPTAYRLPPTAHAYGLQPTAYRSSRLRPTACRLPPTTYRLRLGPPSQSGRAQLQFCVRTR